MTYPFPPEQLYCVLDYETYSEANLKFVGSYEYSKHESTEVICVSWRVGTRETLRNAPVNYWAPGIHGDGLTPPLVELGHCLSNTSYVLVAHNALFEQVITQNVLKPRYLTGLGPTPPERWLCTAALAASLAVPRKLELAAQVLRLPVQKDKDGHKLMLKWAKPRKPTKKNPSLRHTDKTELARVVAYCVQDVEAETLVFLKCPPLTPTERAVWELDQKINLRGFLVDRPLVRSALAMVEAETSRLSRETEAETMGLISSANQLEVIHDWLRSEGVFLPDLRAKTVKDAIDSGLVSGVARTVLEFRRDASKTSTAKYMAFEQRSRSDGRLRDILVYHTASTGRWGGAGIQPQNFPRGSIKDTIAAAAVMSAGDLELVRLIYGEPMAVFSSCLRSMIIAPEGKTLDVADYAGIEARVLAWIAGDKAGIQRFLDGSDAYRVLAAKIFSVVQDAVDTAKRFVGKTAELGCGYGMGWKKFQETCRNPPGGVKGQEISEELAQTAVQTYRDEHPEIVQCWSFLQRAAIAAVENVGTTYTVNKTTWYVKGDFLWCKLPSGRRLAYPQPSVEWLPPPWGGEPVKTLCHWGINNYSRKWEKQRTYGGKLTENVVQAIARDLMAAAMLRIEATGIWEIVLSVHDEIVAERWEFGFTGMNKEFCDLMSELPPWAAGCPVKVEGWEGTRYRK